jgi:hypothetical protein
MSIEVNLVIIGQPAIVDGEVVIELQEDFPYEIDSGAPFGYTVGQAQALPWWKGTKERRHVGRILEEGHPQEGQVVWVELETNPLYHNEITTHGLRVMAGAGSGRHWVPPLDADPFVFIVGGVASNLAVASAIHTSSKYRVLAAWMRDPKTETPSAILGWGIDEPFDVARYTNIANALMAITDNEEFDLKLERWWNNTAPVDRTPHKFAISLVEYFRTAE